MQRCENHEGTVCETLWERFSDGGQKGDVWRGSGVICAKSPAEPRARMEVAPVWSERGVTSAREASGRWTTTQLCENEAGLYVDASDGFTKTITAAFIGTAKSNQQKGQLSNTLELAECKEIFNTIKHSISLSITATCVSGVAAYITGGLTTNVNI